jgi:hypothetical protein
MTATATSRAWITRPAHRIPSSSGSPLQPAKASPCVLGLLGRARPQAHLATEAVI